MREFAFYFRNFTILNHLIIKFPSDPAGKRHWVWGGQICCFCVHQNPKNTFSAENGTDWDLHKSLPFLLLFILILLSFGQQQQLKQMVKTKTDPIPIRNDRSQHWHFVTFGTFREFWHNFKRRTDTQSCVQQRQWPISRLAIVGRRSERRYNFWPIILPISRKLFCHMYFASKLRNNFLKK